MKSIVSYPNRGKYGMASYRGNVTGYLIKDLLNHYRPKVFVDPAFGGKTSLDVVNELNQEGRNIEFYGLDLHSNFNLLKDSLAARIGGERGDYIFFHPAYHNLIRYSSNMWGDKPHPDDLSQCDSYESFLFKMRIAMQNIYDAVAPGKNYSILVGDIRKNGVYTSIQADLLQLAPGSLEGIVIKEQFNCVSDRKTYANSSFISIAHEYLLNFKKNLVFGMLDTTLNISRKLTVLANANWRATVYAALNDLGGKAALPEIYSVIAEAAPEKTQKNINWQARVREILQSYFTSISRGVWAIA